MEFTKVKTPVVIYAESTPNPSSLKLVANKLLLEAGATAEYKTIAETKEAPLANELFKFPFVKSVFISSNYITITKTDTVSWEDITLELREFVKNYIEAGHLIVKELPKVEMPADNTFTNTTRIHTEHAVPANETEAKIIEVLEQYIRPAVEQDGGLIVFKGYEEGKVTVAFKGACSGCPSSTMTLKAGIEGLLKRMVPGVTEVVAENI